MKHRNPPLLFHNEKQSEGIFFYIFRKKNMKNKNVKIEQSKLTQSRFFPRGAPIQNNSLYCMYLSRYDKPSQHRDHCTSIHVGLITQKLHISGRQESSCRAILWHQLHLISHFCCVLSKNIISTELESVSLNERVRLYLNTGKRLLLD